jgi:Family of unknown function (DUF6390)
MLTQTSLPGSAWPILPAGNPGRARSAPPPSGPVLFARYAFGPNRLGYCGPEAIDELFAEGTRGGDDRALRGLARAFEGAWPYLELIALANGIADPLDRRVVDAYWLGSPLLDKVGADLFGASLKTRFAPRLRPDGWRWLAGKPGAGAVPVHAFHVLDVFPRVGLLRSGSVDRALEVMDSCRIRWGRVLERDGEWLVVNVVPLLMVDGQLVLGPARPERVQAWRDGAGFVDGVQPGDIISIHWSWACDRLPVRQLAKLITWTSREVAIANQTI